MSGSRLKKLQEKYQNEKEKRPTLSFSAFIAESALMELERKNILREAQFISFVGENEGMVTLKDFRRGGRFVEVQVKGQELYCISDESKDCIHVGFTLALPEVRRKLYKK